MIGAKRFRMALSITMVGFLGCKTSSIHSSSRNEFRAIVECYAKQHKHYTRQYQSFELWRETMDSLGLTIYYVHPQTNPFMPSLDLSRLPTHFTKIKGNVFFWRENDVDLPTNEVINQLKTVGLLDSTYIKIELGLIRADDAEFPPLVTNEKIKSAKYVVCNNSGKIKYKLNSAYATSTEIPRTIRCE